MKPGFSLQHKRHVLLLFYSLTLTACLTLGLLIPAAHAQTSADSLCAATVEALKRHGVPLETTDDFAPLLKQCACADLLLLGDGTHGSEEFYFLRRLLTLEIMHRQRLDFIALEAGWQQCRSLDRYVRDLPEAPASAALALRGFSGWLHWVWRNREIELLLEQVRVFNRTRAPAHKVAIYGIDVLNFNHSLNVLAQEDSPLGTSAQTIRQCLPAAGDPPDLYPHYLLNGGSSCAACAVQLLDNIPRAPAVLPQALDSQIFHRLLAVETVIRGEQHFRVQAQSPARAWNIRVRHFAAMLLKLLRHHGTGARGVVWAHNTHAGDASATLMPELGMESLGQILRRQIGADNVFILGQTSYSGSVRSTLEWGGEQQVLPLVAARPDSLEHHLNATGIEIGMWLFNPLHSDMELNNFIPHRAVGVVYNPEFDYRDNYMPSCIPRRYDALFFVRQTSATRLVE